MFTDTQFLKSPTGANIAWHHEPATGDARAIVLISHGMAEHSKRYRKFAEFLSPRGFHTYAFDHRGHGETTAPDASLGQFAKKDGWQKVIADTMAMHALATERHAGLPVILFGHSMGAIISFNMAISHPDAFAGVTVWNNDFSAVKSIGALKAVLRLTSIFKGSDTPANLVTKMTFETWGKKVPNNKTLFDWLSHDENEVATYIDDPLCGFPCSVSLWRDVAAMIERGADKANIAKLPKSKPFHLLGGGKDPASNFSKGTEWLADQLVTGGMTNVTKVIYPEARHETLNDKPAHQAMEEFVRWADDVIATA